MDVGVEVVPSDIWVEILQRIPAVDLFRLKAVRKSFYAVISNKLFVQLHLKQQLMTKSTKFIIIFSADMRFNHKTYDTDKRTISVWYDEPRFNEWPCRHNWSDPEHVHRHCVIGSYHGILLVRICDSVFLCNPITRSYKLLPSILDCARSCCWKLAYDDVSEQYKVFGLMKRCNDMVLLYADVHSDNNLEEEDDQFREKKLDRDSHINVVQILKDSVLVNGYVHWLVIIDESAHENKQGGPGTCIVSANVTTEEVKTRQIWSATILPIISIISGDIFAATGTFCKLMGSDRHFEEQLWVVEGIEIENPNPSWRMKHRINIANPVFSNLRKYPYLNISFLGVFRDKVLFMIGKQDKPKHIYEYDISREVFEQVMVVMDDGEEIMRRANSMSFRIVEHVDTLISL